MIKYKVGSDIQILLEFTEEEWDAITPYDQFKVEARNNYDNVYEMEVEEFPNEYSILLSADTKDWELGGYKLDILMVIEGVTVYFPSKTFINFELIEPATEII